MLSSPRRRVRLGQIEQQMRSLEDQMSLLRVEKETIENDLAAIVYPVLTLPNEITSKIFVHYVDSDDPWTDSPWGHLTLFNLLSVCRSWRQVALSTCWLFDRISSRYVDQLASWLPLSGNLPLTLRFTSYYPSSSSEFRVLCQLLSEYSARWQSLTISTMRHGDLPVHLPGTFSSLTALTFATLCSCVDPTIMPILHAPRLVELRLEYGRTMSQWETALPWTQLTELEINAGFERWWQLLAHTPNLEILHFTGVSLAGVPENQIQSMPMIVLPQLQRLEFHLINCCDIIGHLTLPALQSLTIAVTGRSDWELMEPFIARSSCTMHTLELWMYSMDEENLVVDFFDAVPLSSVRNLIINAPTKETLSFLFDTLNDDAQFIPGLEILKIVDLRFQIPFINLVDMLSARTQRVPSREDNVANLKSFELTFGSGVTWDPDSDNVELYHELDIQVDAAVERLCHLQSGGLRVDIQSTFKHMGDAVDLNMIERIRAHGDSFRT